MNGYVQWAKANNSLLVFTFDEDDGGSSTQYPIATFIVGPGVKPGVYNEAANCFSLLRTFEDMYGLPYAGAAATATPITDIFATTASTPDTTTQPGRLNRQHRLLERPAAINGAPAPLSQQQRLQGLAEPHFHDDQPHRHVRERQYRRHRRPLRVPRFRPGLGDHLQLYHFRRQPADDRGGQLCPLRQRVGGDCRPRGEYGRQRDLRPDLHQHTTATRRAW